MQHIAVGNISFNATTNAYEARVDIKRHGRTYKYPCSVSGTMTMDDTAIRHSLTKQAITMAGRNGGLHSTL